MKISEVMSRVKKSLKGNKKTKKFIPNLSATPSFVCFKNYEEGKVYKENIQILNKDLKSYFIAIKFDNPDEIKLSVVGSVSKTRIDSGENLLLEVEFRPISNFRKESVDRRYEICLNVVNANSKFFIPVIVLSPNPFINFPKEISLPDTAVNTPAYSNIFILNFSNQNCKFSFQSRSDVKIIPECKSTVLKAADGSSYLVEFTPKTVGNFREKIYVIFDTGKRISIPLKCNVIPVNIFLNEENIKFSPTFIGMTDSKEIHIVNNSDEVSNFEWISNGSSAAEKYLQIIPLNGELQPNTVTTVSLIFKPEDTDNDESEILKEVAFLIALKLSLAVDYNPSIDIRGKVVGPSFQFNQNKVDIGAIFLGESRIVDLAIANTGVIDGKVMFQKSPSSFDGIVKVSSKIEKLSPGETKSFKLKYLARRPGKFFEPAFFKVKNGDRLSFVIQGEIKPLEIIVEPNFLDFSNTSICIPRMQTLTISNPLPFEIDVKVEIDKTGTDEPLEFLEFFSSIQKSFREADAKSSVSSVTASSIWESNDNASCSSILSRLSIKNYFEQMGSLGHLQEAVAAAQDGIKNFHHRVEQYLDSTEIVQNIIHHIFDNKVRDELEKHFVIDTIVDLLVENIKGRDLMEFKQKDWTLPENPREVEINQTIIRLPANNETSAVIKIFLTPNFIGKYKKNLKLRLSLPYQSLCPKQSIEETVVEVPISFNCQPANLIVHNKIASLTGFAESEIPFEVLLENSADVDGFFTFLQIGDAEMIVKCEGDKFHIASKAKKIIKLIVTPLKSGSITKNINLVVLGSNQKIPVRIECKSLPPDIIVKPDKVFEDNLTVLTAVNTRIFIENRGTAKARFNVKLEHENEAFDLDPKGGIMSSKQCVLVVLKKYFHDPGEYKNTLIIEIVNGRTIKIPINCTVRKLPIIIEPPFLKAVDFGTLFVSKTPYFLEHTFKNCGRNTYMVYIILKSLKDKTKTRYIVEPNRLELKPEQIKTVKFFLNAESASRDEEYFTIEGCSSNAPTRQIVEHSFLKANVIKPLLSFSQNDIDFKCFYKGNFSDVRKSIEVINKSELPLTVALKVEGQLGQFFVACQKLHTNQMSLRFDMKASETREIFFTFNSSIIGSLAGERACEFYGNVKVFTLGKIQQTINLKAIIIYPTIESSQSELNITNNMLTKAFTFTIRNNGEIDSIFNLKFVETSTTFAKIQERKQTDLKNVIQLLMAQTCNLSKTFFEPDSRELQLKSSLSRQHEKQKSLMAKDLLVLYDLQIDESDEETKEEKVISKNAQDHLETSDSLFVTLSDVQQYFNQVTRFSSKVFHNHGHKFAKADSKTSQLNENLNSNEFAIQLLKLSHAKGIMKPGEERLISILFTGSNGAFHLSTTLALEVQGGLTQNIAFNLVNCNPNVLVSKTHFEIPDHHTWDEILVNNVCLKNISQASSQIKLIPDRFHDERRQLINGYVKFSSKTDLCFTLDEQRNFCADIKFSIFSGCSGMFKSEFGIQVNEKPPIPITFAAKNLMQTATLINIDHHSIYEIDKNFEYDCLRQFYKHLDKIVLPDEFIKLEDILAIKTQMKMDQENLERLNAKSRRKNVKNDKKKKGEEETASRMTIPIDHASGDSGSISEECKLRYDLRGVAVLREKKTRLHSAKMLHMIDESLDEEGFQVLDYPEEYPESIGITNFIQQQGLTESLQTEDVFKEFKEIYNRHVLANFSRSKTSNPIGKTLDHSGYDKILTVVPLPLVLQPYEISFGPVVLNQSTETIVQFYFNGSTLAASLRTEAFVAGLSLRFLQDHSAVDVLKVINFEEPSQQLSGFYKNRIHRENNKNDSIQPAIKRCHSFDFTSNRVHSRKIPTTAGERNQIIRTYNEVMSTKPKEKPKTFVQSEVFQKKKSSKDSKVFKFQITFSPSSDRFEVNSEFDEIVYLDIHLGPQIPINLKAKLVEQFLDPVQNDQVTVV